MFSKRIASLVAGASLAAATFLAPQALAQDTVPTDQEACEAAGMVWVDGYDQGENWLLIPEGHKFVSADPDVVYALEHDHEEVVPSAEEEEEEEPAFVIVKDDTEDDTYNVILTFTASQGTKDSIPDDADYEDSSTGRVTYVIERTLVVGDDECIEGDDTDEPSTGGSADLSSFSSSIL